MWWIYLIAGVVLLSIAYALLQKGGRIILVGILLLPFMWVISFVLFPFNYIKGLAIKRQIVYNNIEEVKLRLTDDGIDIMSQDGKIKHYKEEETKDE